MLDLISALWVNLPILAALAAAVAVALVLVARRHDLVSALALGGFIILFLTYLLGTFSPSVAMWLAWARPARNAPLILRTFALAENTMAALAVGCLVGAVWLGLHRTGREDR